MTGFIQEHAESEINIIYSICLITLHQRIISCLHHACIRSKSIYRLKVHTIQCEYLANSSTLPSSHTFRSLDVIWFYVEWEGIQTNTAYFDVCVSARCRTSKKKQRERARGRERESKKTKPKQTFPSFHGMW